MISTEIPSFLDLFVATWNDLNIPNIDNISVTDFKKELYKLMY